MRKYFKHVRGKVKDELASFGVSAGSTASLPGAQPDPIPTPDRAQSHSQVDGGGDSTQGDRPPANIQGISPPTGTLPRALGSQNDAAHLAVSPLVHAETSPTTGSAPGLQSSIPKPDSCHPSVSTLTTRTHSAPSQAVDPEPVARVTSVGTYEGPDLKAVGDKTPSKLLDTAPSTPTNPEPVSINKSPQKDEDNVALSTDSQHDMPATQSISPPKPQGSPSVMALRSRSNAAHPPSPTFTAMNPASSEIPKTWKYFNRFQQSLGTAVGFAPLRAVMGELGDIISMCEDVAEARSDYAALKNELEELFSVLSTHFSSDIPPTMTAGMNNLCTAIQNELDVILSKEKRGTGRRYVEANQDLDDVMACYQRIHGHLERLRLNADLSIWQIVDKQATEIRLNSLNPSRSSYYNSAEAQQIGRRECTPHTRKQVLADLSHWRHDRNQGNMYWLSGMAGTGKTTIASSLCKMLDESHELAASFFCTRLRPECRDVKLILPTIAYQLARFSRPFCHALSSALERDSELHAKTLPIQLEGLIVGPLRTAAAALPQDLVVVIDALDECEDGGAIGELLKNLALYAPDLPLKIFVSSRPEFQIRQNIGDPKSKLILHELEESIVKEDIKLYLETELRHYSISIGDAELSNLAERAGVLFIYAATVVRYIGSANSTSRRQKRVRTVLETSSPGSSKTGSHVDPLYSAILDSAFDNPELEEDEVTSMKLVLDTVVCAREPLTVQALARLLKLGDESAVQDALEPLWSVLHVSSHDQLVATLHASFPDYMLDRSRSKRHACPSETHHGLLTEMCLDRINSNEKQFNICELKSSHMFDEQVEGLDAQVKRNIPQDLFYACRYWAIHLELGGPSADRLPRIHSFIADRLLLWMEVLNLKKQIGTGSSIMQKARHWCEEGNASQETKDLAHDAWRFITMFATNDISRSTAHIYVSMLASWPSSGSLALSHTPRVHGLSRVGGTGMTRRELALLGVVNARANITSVGFSLDSMRIVSGSGNNEVRVWDAQTGKLLLGPLEGHTRLVNSVAFSPDGTSIVSGSNDKTIRVWDAQTGKTLLDPIEGHTASVGSVAFSPDSMRIVSGSYDDTILVWDVSTGQRVLGPLKGHTDSVLSVAFSPDAMRIVSGSEDMTILVWEAETGKPLLDPLRGHTASVGSVAFSPDGTRIVSGSDDKTIRMWDPQTGKPLIDPLKGHTSSVDSVAFSLDGTRTVSGSPDKTIRVWDARTSYSLNDPLEGHTGSINSVGFSPDGMRVISGSSDKSIRVWETGTGKSLTDPLKGHTGSTKSVAFSPDGMRIVSCSHDKTIRVWDARTGRSLLGPLKGHTDSVYSVALSPDGMRIASGSNDKTVRVWDTQTGNSLLDPLRGHTRAVGSVEFSPNGIHIVSGSSDHTIRVWDAHTGTLLLDPIQGHTSWVNSVAFSADGTRIASGSSDTTIRVWDVQTGKPLLDPLVGHTSLVKSVAFSPDGTCIVSGSNDMTVRVWDAQTGQLLRGPLKGHTSVVRSVAISFDGRFIVSGSTDKTVRVWQSREFQARIHSNRPCSWMLDDRGWVVDEHQRLLLWLPPDLRDRLVLPDMVCLISPEGFIQLDLSNAKLGESWVSCYTPPPRI